MANMYFIPMGMLLRSESDVVAAAGKVAADLVGLDLSGFLGNLLSVTTGNIFGGAFMVAAIYWFIYRRPQIVEGGIQPRRIYDLFVGRPPVEDVIEHG